MPYMTSMASTMSPGVLCTEDNDADANRDADTINNCKVTCLKCNYTNVVTTVYFSAYLQECIKYEYPKCALKLTYIHWGNA